MRNPKPLNQQNRPVMRIFFDTEFIEDGKTIDLLSIRARQS